MGTEDVTWRLDGRVATVTLDHPPVNALRTRTWDDLGERFAEVAATSASAVVLRSASPRIFSAGADVNELPMPPEVDERRQALTRRVLASVLAFPVPVVCAVPGPALGGGCALAAVCDIRLGTPSTSFGLPEINVGRCGGGRYLMRHLPQGVLRRAYFTGHPIAADDALRFGLVQEIHADAAALDEASASLASEIAAQSPTAVRLAKQSLDLAEELPLARGYEVEQQFSLRLGTTADAAEAAAAFREKRAPRWTEV